MHCELIVPGLFAEASGTRAPALELLLARGRGASTESKSPEAWLQQAFGLEGEALAAGALTLAAAGGEPGTHCWGRADPVHLRLMRDRLIVVPSAAFALSRDEAEALAEALNRHFGDRMSLRPLEPGRWCARLDRHFAFNAASPLDAAGRDVDLAPHIGGEAGRRWATLLNEAQMLLHAHPVNLAREARGEPAVNSLWLWGAGRAQRAECAWQSVAADDPAVIGAARLAGARHRALPRSAREWLERLPEDGRHLAVLDGTRVRLALGQESILEELEKQWFEPLLAALRSGRVGMFTVHVPDGAEAVSFETIRADLRRLWRLAKPIKNYT